MLSPYARSFTIGSAFAVGWTPCIGPILGAILTLATSSATVLQGALLLLAWSAGLGLPFLLTALALERTLRVIRRLGPLLPILEVVGGALVVIVGMLIFLDRFTIFNSYFAAGATTVIGAEGQIAGLGISGFIGLGAAFLAGIVAFLSPCCLPLVPAYLGHLASTSGEVDGDGKSVTFRHALAYVLGFSVVFVALGASVGAFGYAARDALPTIEKVAGIILIVMGLNLAGVIRIPLLFRTFQIDLETAHQTAK